MLAGSRPAARRAASASGRFAIGMPNLEAAAPVARCGCGDSVQCRVQAEADARIGVVGGERQQGAQLLQRLRVDQGAGAQGQVQLLIPLAHAVHHDPLGGNARSASERQLDGRHDLGAGAIAGKPAEQLRIRIRLDGVRDQRAREGVAVGGQIGGRRVQVGQVERRPPARDCLVKDGVVQAEDSPAVAAGTESPSEAAAATLTGTKAAR